MSASNRSSSQNADPGERVAAVVLAGGAGHRFRQSIEDRASKPAGSVWPDRTDRLHKLLVEFRGKPLVHWAIRSAHQASFERLYVVTGAADVSGHAAAVSEHAVVLKNRNWAAGQATSLALAIDTAAADGFDAIIVGLGDQPLVPPEAWRSVADGAGPIVVASFAGSRRPPVKLAKSVWAEVPRDGDAGARNLIRLRPELVSEISCIGNPVDIDTIEDLELWN